MQTNDSTKLPSDDSVSVCLVAKFVLVGTEWAIKNRPPTCQLIMSSKSNVHLK